MTGQTNTFYVVSRFKKVLRVMMLFTVITHNSLRAEEASVPIPQEITAAFKPYKIGTALLTKVVFDIYQVVLYSSTPKWSYNNPFALHVHYLRDISADQLNTSTLEAINYQTKLSPESVAEYTAFFKKIYKDVKEGDDISAIYTSSKTISIYQNKQLIGTITDPVMAKCFMDIWVGENNEFPEFHSQLMGTTPAS